MSDGNPVDIDDLALRLYLGLPTDELGTREELVERLFTKGDRPPRSPAKRVKEMQSYLEWCIQGCPEACGSAHHTFIFVRKSGFEVTDEFEKEMEKIFRRRGFYADDETRMAT